MAFTPSRDLLNPKFEGYRFDPIAQDDYVSQVNLAHKASQSTASTRSFLSFEEIQSRVSHNHLAVSEDEPLATYLDTDFNVILIRFSSDSSRPRVYKAYELPRPISSGAETIHREYPSAAFLSGNLLFQADGSGILYIFRIKDGNEALDLLATSTLPASDLPFRIHSVNPTGDGTAVALLSSRYYPPTDTAEPRRNPDFDIWAASFDLTITSGTTQPMNIIWRRRGQSVPGLTAYDVSRRSHMILAGSPYRDIEAVDPNYAPSPDEIVPIPRETAILDPNITELPRPPPYSWTQTSDAVTVVFPLASSTSKSDIQVLITSKTLNLHVRNTNQPTPIEASLLPEYSRAKLWDGVLASSSFWTWDREGERSFGLLTLYLDKQHEGTRWMHVFAAGEEDLDIPETVDPSELHLIMESLEKYTAALRSGDDASGLGLGRGVPSLGQGEMDEEVDTAVGRMSFVTWVASDGSHPPWFQQGGASPIQLLSTSLPGTTGVSLAVKHDLDGAAFDLYPATDAAEPPRWEHTSTYSALAFVLASKRDVRITHHLPGEGVWAFENGIRGSNVYIYKTTRPNEKWGKQAILKMGDGASGSLLGVGVVKIGNKILVLCLLEERLVMIKTM